MNLLEFFREVRKIKDIERSGWIERGVEKPESVGDHSFMTALLTLFLSEKRSDIDTAKAVKMALIHDIAESRTGDLMLWTGEVTKEEKHRREQKSLEGMLANVDPDMARKYADLWQEFEDQQTPEARFVRQIDKIDMILEAVEYHKSGRSEKSMVPFFDSVSLITDPELVTLLKKVDGLKDHMMGR